MQLDNPSNPALGFNQQVQIAYKGNSNWPAFGTPKFLERVAIATRLQADWAMDADVLWNSLFDTRTYGPIQLTTQTYSMDKDVFFLSDWVYILRTDGNTDRYRVVHPNARNDNTNGIGMTGGDFGSPLCYLTGSASMFGNTLTINFPTPFSQYPLEVGGTIQVGVYKLPKFPNSANGKVIIDNPMWLVWMTAAEEARNDPAKQDQVPNLTGMANQAYEKMVTLNQGNSFQQPNGPSYANQPNIGVTWEQF